MNMKKLISAASAAAVAVSALSLSASASLEVIDNIADESGLISFSSGTGSWMPVVYSDGTFDASEKGLVDYGLDLKQIASVEVVITPVDKDWWEGEMGGAIVLSNKSADDSSHNWNGKEFWGVIDPELELETRDDTKAVTFEKTGDYEYTGVMYVDDTNNVVDNYSLVQIAVQEWSTGMTDMKILGMTVKDASGNVMISFDENGNASLPNLAGAAPAEEAAAEETAAEETVAETEAAPAETEAAPAETEAAPAETEAAPAETEAAPVETAAPAAGDVQAATTSAKGSPNTGIADVAAIAGLAVLAGGAVVVAKKRK